jgi:hypothetical protein
VTHGGPRQGLLPGGGGAAVRRLRAAAAFWAAALPFNLILYVFARRWSLTVISRGFPNRNDGRWRRPQFFRRGLDRYPVPLASEQIDRERAGALEDRLRVSRRLGQFSEAFLLGHFRRTFHSGFSLAQRWSPELPFGFRSE